jgi:hypothetical protein
VPQAIQGIYRIVPYISPFFFAKIQIISTKTKLMEYYLIKEIDLAAHLLQTLHYSLINEAK